MRALLTIIILLTATAVTASMYWSKGEAGVSVESLPTHEIDRGEVLVTVTEQGTLESSNNTEIKCLVRGDNTITSVVESGTEVEPGEVLVTLETLAIDEEISERTKFYHLAQSTVARSEADVERARIAILEYKEGRYISEMASLKKELAIAESRLLNAKNRHKHSEMLKRSEYASDLEVEERSFTVEQAELNVGLVKTRIEVLEKFTRQEEIVRLEGELNAALANHKAEVERSIADQKRLERAQEELEFCTIKAKRAGMVIYPTSEQWKEAPEIEEGATVHKDQVLLLMPDLKQMQVKVGVHESMIKRVHKGLEAKVTLNKKSMKSEVASVASVAKPASWWTGTVVKYDTVIQLPEAEGLKPGMSAEVEILLARHDDVVRIPTNAVVESMDGHACWVVAGENIQRRAIELGDNSDMFIVVKSGLQEGEVVVIDPLANVEEAQLEAASIMRATEDGRPKFEEL